MWDALKGVDRVKARVLSEAANRADGRAYLALLTLWESGAAEEDYQPYRRRRRYYDDYEEDSGQGEYEMGEIYETTLTAEDWSDADGGRPPFGPMEVEREEIVPPESLTA